jgi:hypothetical protein
MSPGTAPLADIDNRGAGANIERVAWHGYHALTRFAEDGPYARVTGGLMRLGPMAAAAGRRTRRERNPCFYTG